MHICRLTFSYKGQINEPGVIKLLNLNLFILFQSVYDDINYPPKKPNYLSVSRSFSSPVSVSSMVNEV